MTEAMNQVRSIQHRPALAKDRTATILLTDGVNVFREEPRLPDLHKVTVIVVGGQCGPMLPTITQRCVGLGADSTAADVVNALTVAVDKS